MKNRKKLIEVALPLDAVNKAAAREKSIRHGHPSTLHLWWARRPLAAARAVIFSQMVDDPSEYVDVLLSDAKKRRAAERERKKRLDALAAKRSAAGGGENAEPEPALEEVIAEQERERLFGIIEALVLWENTTNEKVLERARAEIRQSWRRACAENAGHPRAKELFDRHRLPAFHDPFAGGGALPLEAQRLGLEAHASDLNPVAVLINKAMIEIPPKFAARPPVNPEWRSQSEEEQTLATWRGAQGLAEDVRYYGQWMRDEAEKRIGHLYPKVEITTEMVRARPDLKPYKGKKLTVIAWLWARTVKSPNPAFAGVDVPLVSTFMLSTKKGKEAYVEPVIEGKGYRFTVKVGVPPDADAAKLGTTAGKRRAFRCAMSGVPVTYDHIRSEGRHGRMGARLMAIVAEGDRGRIYLAPTPQHEAIAHDVPTTWKPDIPLPDNPRDFKTPNYGLPKFADLFTPRQLVALTTFSDLVTEAMERVKDDYLGARASRPHKVWHSRGYLPHFDRPETVQFLTFRLADAVPAATIAAWKAELKLSGGEAADDPRCGQLRESIDRYADQGHGACWLQDDRVAKLVEDALLHFDRERYRLLAWVIMPNHVHALIETLPGFPLGEVMHSWKSFTAKRANRLLGRSGAFWMEDYFDRYIRDEKHLSAVRRYMEENPVKAGLARSAKDWRWLGPSSRLEEEEDAGETPALPGEDDRPLRDGGTGARAYAEAVGVYLAFALSKVADRGSSLGRWDPTPTQSGIINTFSRQAIPMSWDFGESNPLGEASGSFVRSVDLAVKATLPIPTNGCGEIRQDDARFQSASLNKVVSTDPPYYDNIGYADLSDFFYVWLRKSLRPIFPDLFATLAVPKAEELVATPYRHGNKEKAETFFLDGMGQTMHRLAEQAHSGFPVTIYYAFKQSERKGDTGVASTGWETFLDAVIRSGFAVTGTWPMRTELANRMIGMGSNALASSIVLVCRRRPANAPVATRREFVAALQSELPAALAHLQRGNIAPVDLAQAAIGPGMAVYTRYAKVLDAQGKALSVREALALINRTLDEALAEQEGDFDADSRWALAWFEQSGFDEGVYGVAETLSKAKNTSVDGMVEAGILASKGGTVRLLKPVELPADWDPTADTRLTAWEMVHHLVRALETGGDKPASKLVAQLGANAETARELCYRLYTLCERKKRAAEAASYNSLVQSWPEITRLVREREKQAPQDVQTGLFGEAEN